MASGLRILLMSCLRDEGPNLLHWIAHNRSIGVTDFLLFTNDCSDGTDDILDRLEDAGVVTHIRNHVPKGKTPQWSALHLAKEHPLTQAADWIAHLDCDEYLNIRAPYATLQDVVTNLEADAIALPWRLFGHNGHARRPDLPPTRAFTRAIPEDALYPALSRFIKTLYRRRGPFQKPGVHRPKQTGTARWVDGSGQAMDGRFSSTPSQIMIWGDRLANGILQLNHYSLRSAEDYIAKMRRGLPNHTDKALDLTYWVERNFNTVIDDSILRLEPGCEHQLAELRACPGVAEAEAQARDWHARGFAAAMSDPAMVKIYGRLLLARSSVPPTTAMARHLVDLFQRASWAQS